MIKKLLFAYFPFLIILFLPAKSFTQTYTDHLSSIREHTNHFLHLTPEKGLSQGYVTCIFQDYQGLMWFGTKDGLNRYDGYEFKHYKYIPEDSCSIGNSYILAIAEDAQKRLWIGTVEGLYCFDPVTECFRLVSDRVLSADYLFIDKQQAIWVGDNDGSLYHINPENLSIKKYSPKTKQERVRGIQESKSGNLLYILNGLNRIAVFDKVTHHFRKASQVPPPRDSCIRQLFTDKTDKVWVFCYESTKASEQIRKIDPVSGKITHLTKPTPKGSINPLNTKGTFTQDSQGMVWINGKSSLIKLDPAKSSYADFFPHLGRYPYVLSLFVDRSGIVWVGTLGHGIFAENPKQNKIQNYQKKKEGEQALSFASIRAIHEDPQNNLWIGGYGGLNMFSSDTAIHFSEVPPLKKGFSIYALCDDPGEPQKTLWMSVMHQGLYRFDKEKKVASQVFPTGAKKAEATIIFDILPDQNNILWLATSLGLYKFNTQTLGFTLYKHLPNSPLSIPKGDILSVYKDRRGTLWVATQNGFARFDQKSGEFTRYFRDASKSNSLNCNYVYALYEDKAGRFWVATGGGGLNLFNRETEKFQYFTEKNGLPNNVVYGVLEDDQGKLWLSTNLGISGFDPVHRSFTNYDKGDGLQGNEFNRHAFYKSRANKMFFGGTNGVSSFYPKNLKKNNYLPPIVITKFKKFNQEIPFHQVLSPDSVLQLSHKDAVVSIEFTALNYYNTHKNQYAYKLEGLHQDWIQLGTRHEITFVGLKAGDYTLHIRASNNDGLWNKKGKIIKISVVPPFWATWWFRIGVGVMLLGLIIIGYSQRLQSIKRRQLTLENEVNLRTKELKKANQTKDRFFSIIAHDLRGPLASFQEIGYLINYFLKKGETHQIQKLGTQIDQSAQKLHGLLNNLLNWALVQQKAIAYHPENIYVQPLIEECLSNYQGTIQRHQIKVSVNIPANLSIWADYNSITSILRNLISNALKFTPNLGQIDILAKVVEEEIVLSIKDEGIGMTSQELNKIFDITHKKSKKGLRGEEGSGLGLTLSREFARLNQCKLAAESIPEKGTTFYLTFKKQPAKDLVPS
ncbi:MAG TPA: histidine kinase [Microscillaceae bacterium]|nr:histidine kinase [Microscillaceae bacterium]